MRDQVDLVEHLHLPDHLVEGAIAHGGHHLAHLFGDEEEIIDDVLGQALEALAQHRILRRDADRAGVEVAHPHHDAAGGDQRRGREAELVGPEHRAHDDVAPGAQAAIDLHGDASAQPVRDQRLVRLGEPDLPRASRVLDRGERRGAGAALETRDRHVVGARLRDAGRDRADAHFGYQLHRHVARRIDVLEIEDELREVLDRIDVVVRRRRDQADARGRVAHLGDHRVDLVAGQLAAFAGLGALRHLDLHHVGIDQILRGHAEPARGDLLDRRAHGIPVRKPLEPVRLLAAFPGVRLAADAVHGDGERRVRLAADRAERHGAGRKPLHDLLGGLDLFQRHRRAPLVLRRLDAEQAADGEQLLGLLVHDRRERAVFVERVAAYRVLEQSDRLGRPGVRLAAHAEQIFAADFERVTQHG